ncbi:putative vegetative cell wall protein gp1-like isoform X3 [Iris pallida]|uniref:Vegetative cell wall protein gp1-like isoform X3 n=1 Tax=Iris pallida TaxID=29817 RepID=A0AAX6DKC4_IRIPA|nr:putative vegetative cell wall protein gp1-like isoform X3 [Iris pallida]
MVSEDGQGGRTIGGMKGLRPEVGYGQAVMGLFEGYWNSGDVGGRGVVGVRPLPGLWRDRQRRWYREEQGG